jgi:acyl-CoA reductase-like NAD-dependent aldehyde dehydrogenase
MTATIGQKTELDRTRFFIKGEWVEPRGTETRPQLEAATGEVLGTAALGSDADIHAAVSAARDALDRGPWGRSTAEERAEALRRFSAALSARADFTATLVSRENGMPIGLSTAFNGSGPAGLLQLYAEAITTTPMEAPRPSPSGATLVRREPVGVVGQIIPWNGPIAMFSWKIAPALACGNVSVIKPAEQTPLTALRLGELILEAGIPEGVVNIVTGCGETAGAAIASHPDIDKVAFTGSTEVGKLILKASAGNLKRVSLELGGKSPNIIFADANMEQAVPTSLFGFTMLSGQVCCAGTRVFVQQDFHDEFVDKLTRFAGSAKAGNPLDPKTTVGPLVSKEQFDRVKGYLALGKEEGAKARVGGEAGTGKGYFVDPTVFTGVKNDMRIAREEIFGPVASVIPFKDENDAVLQGNDTTYGLAAAVWTNDVSRAHKVARALKAGTVWVNCYNNIDPISPFGGYKQSGIGRELGKHSIELYTQVKSVYVKL